jgi:uncharacterized protein
MKIFKNVQIDSREGLPILIDVVQKQTNLPKPIIIFSHGFKSFKDWGTFNLVAKAFAEAGFVFVKFNFSHNGTTDKNPDQITDTQNFGMTNIENELDDLDSVINWVLSNDLMNSSYIKKEELYLIGHSRGASTCILKAYYDQRIKKVITWGAFNDFDKIWANYDLDKWKEEGVSWTEIRSTGQLLPLYYQHYENYLANKDKFYLPKAIEELKIPFFAIHGMEDEVVGYEQTLEMKMWNKEMEFSLLPNTGHTFSGYHPYTQTYLPFDTRIAVKESIDFLRGELK